MSRLIDADALMADLEKWLKQIDPTHPPEDNAIPPMEDIIVSTLMTIEEQPTIEPQRMKGKWIEKTVAENPKAAGIEEWQSCKCSNCGGYDTRPYMYYFDEPKYCSWCGAWMGGRNEL